MYKHLKDYFRHIPLTEVMRNELEEAEREKLKAEEAVEYAQSIVEYNQKRINRLRERLKLDPASKIQYADINR